MSRDSLHDLINRLPEGELYAAKRFLEFLSANAAYRAVQYAAPDDEPVTAGDAQAIALARDDVREGRVVPHEDILREFGLR